MKAKLYEFQDKLEIKFSDETIYYPKKGEAKEDFIERIKSIAIDEYLEEEFVLVTINKEAVETNTDADLQEAFKKAEGLQRNLIMEVLTDRGLLAAKKPPREKIPAKGLEEMKASDEYKEAESRIGEYAKFSPFKKLEVYKGKIVGVALNKTNTIIYYTIVCDEDNKRRCCGVLNETLEYLPTPADAGKGKKTVAKKEEVVETAATEQAAQAAPKATKLNKTGKKNQSEATSDDAGDVKN